MLEHVLNLIKKDRLDEAIEFIKKDPIVKVKESEVFIGDVFPWNDPIVLEDRIIFSAFREDNKTYYGTIYVLDKSLSLIKEFKEKGLGTVEYANGKIYAGFNNVLYEFDLNLNVLKRTEFDFVISDIIILQRKISSLFWCHLGKR